MGNKKVKFEAKYQAYVDSCTKRLIYRFEHFDGLKLTSP